MDLAFTEQLITKHEGTRGRVYQDTRGIPTVGKGFNLLAPGAPAIISDLLHVDYGQLLHGFVELSTEQVETLFRHSLNAAIGWAKRDVTNFDDLHPLVQAVVVDIAYNIGAAGLAGFKRAIARLHEKDYLGAATEFKTSLWFNQVGKRATEDISLLEQAAKESVVAESV